MAIHDYQIFKFELEEPICGSIREVHILGRDEAEARARAMERGYKIVPSEGENKFLQAMLEALNNKK